MSEDVRKRTGGEAEVTPLVSFDCPHCGGKVTAGYDDELVGTVLHSLPACDRFEALPPDRFLESCRRVREG